MSLLLRVTLLVLYIDVGAFASKLIFVNMMYRHGARTPTYFYPTDPYAKDKTFTALGKGVLTERGRKEHLQLGAWLLKEYGQLLTDPSHVAVQATAVDRVQESARCNLAAMFPKHGKHVTDSKGKTTCTTSIKIKVVERAKDKVLSMGAPCPAYQTELKTQMSAVQKKHEKEFHTMTDPNKGLLKEKAGLKANELNLDFLYKIYDTLHVEHEDFKLKLPDWTKSVYPDKLKKAAILRFELSSYTDILKKLGPGLLLEEWIKNMEDKANGNNKLNANIYAAHDGTIVNLLNTLGVYDGKTLPEYAACVMMELWEDGPGKHSVKLYYKRNPDKEKEQLHPLKCSSSCPLKEFKEKSSKYIPKNWDAECHGGKNH